MKTQRMFAKKYLPILVAALVGINSGFLFAQTKPRAFESKSQSTILLNRTFADVLRGSTRLDSGPTQIKPFIYKSPNEQEFKKGGSVIGLFWSALIGGALGYLGGGLLGYEIESSSCNDNYEDSFCGIAGFLIGASAGGALLMPLGTHIANGGRGNSGVTLLATLGATGLAWGIAAANESAEDLFVMVPLFQVATSIAVERITGKNQ